MMNGGDLYELAKILGHSNIASSNTAREIWKLMEREQADKTNVN